MAHRSVVDVVMAAARCNDMASWVGRDRMLSEDCGS